VGSAVDSAVLLPKKNNKEGGGHRRGIPNNFSSKIRHGDPAVRFYRFLAQKPHTLISFWLL